ncbi:pseudouridine synthase [Mycoplasmatota bacterium zrk1]
MRLDKFLSKCGFGSRSDTKKIIKTGKVTVNGRVINKTGYIVDELEDVIKYKNDLLNYRKYVYLMLNKPKGVVSATQDNLHKTIIDLLEDYKEYDLHPVGRLDLDTEGLVILTNDGKLTHRIISPKNHISKIYKVKLDKVFNKTKISVFEEGITLNDGYKCLPSDIEIIDEKTVLITIFEGKFHQVKRMFQSIGNKVLYLKRISINGVQLDDKLKLSEYRELTKDELDLLNK